MVLYVVFAVSHTAFAVHGSDTSGYFNAARLLGSGELKVHPAQLDVLHLDDSWRDTYDALGLTHIRDRGMFAPSYPLGYPILLLLLARIGGWGVAPFLVVAFSGATALIATYLLAREFDLPPELGAWGAAIVGSSPGWLFSSLLPMSDVPAAMFCAVTMLFAMRSQRAAPWAAFCGVAFGCAVWVRPTNILLALPIAFSMRWRIRQLAIAVLSALPPGIALMLTNRYLFGSAFTTGYGSFDMTLGKCAPHHLFWLAATLTPVVFPAGAAVFFFRRVPLWQRLTLAAWMLVFLTFYSAYPICDDWWYLRFLLPAFPAMVIAFLLVLRERVTRAGIRFAIVAVVLLFALGFDRRYRLRDLAKQMPLESQIIARARRVLPPNAFVATMQMSGSYFYYTHQLAGWYESFDPDRFEEFRAYAANAGVPIYALVFDWEEAALRRRMPGRWTKVDGLKNAMLLRFED